MKLEDLLQFATGASQIPPMGFDKLIDIKFFPFTDGNKNYPTASTCGMEIFLPRGVEDVTKFCQLMTEGIVSSPGFGKI